MGRASRQVQAAHRAEAPEAHLPTIGRYPDGPPRRPQPPIPASLSSALRMTHLGARQPGRRRGDLIGEPAPPIARRRRPRGAAQLRGKCAGSARRGRRGSYITANIREAKSPPSAAEDDFRLANLTLVPHCPTSHGSRAAAKPRRSNAGPRWTGRLLAAMAGHQGAGVMQLAAGGDRRGQDQREAQPAGFERAWRNRLNACPGRAWSLTDQGRAVAMEARPLIDDARPANPGRAALVPDGPRAPLAPDRGLSADSETPRQLARRARVARRRRATVLFDHQPGHRGARPQVQPPSRWVRIEAISAAAAKDVADRPRVDDRTQEERVAPVRWRGLRRG